MGRLLEGSIWRVTARASNGVEIFPNRPRDRSGASMMAKPRDAPPAISDTEVIFETLTQSVCLSSGVA